MTPNPLIDERLIRTEQPDDPSLTSKSKTAKHGYQISDWARFEDVFQKKSIYETLMWKERSTIFTSERTLLRICFDPAYKKEK